MKSSSRPRVLVVDDDQDIRESLQVMLQDLGCEVLLAQDGHAGMMRAERDSPDLVILDLMIPHRSGIAVLDSIKSRPVHRLPVIMMSGSTEVRHQQMAESRGADGWLRKPFDIPHFLKIVQRFLPSRKPLPVFEAATAHADAVLT